MKMFSTLPFPEFDESFAKSRVCRGSFKERIHQRPQIEPRAAYENGHFSTRLNLTDRTRRILGPVGGGVIDVWIDVVDQVVWNPTSFLHCWFRRRNLDLAIDLYRI